MSEDGPGGRAADPLREAENLRDETRWLEDALRRRTRDLSERTKELECLHRLADLAGDPALSWDDFLRKVADALPAAWQYPEDACARVTWDGRTFLSDGFRDSPWRLKADAGTRGSVEVFYRRARPRTDEGPFLKEERRLLDTVAAWVAQCAGGRRRSAGGRG